MRFIDKNGKLFGLVNVVDALSLIVLIGFLFSVYLGYRVLGSKNQQVLEWVRIKVRCESVIPELAYRIQPGNVGLNNSELASSEVLGVYDIKPARKVNIFMNGRAACVEDSPNKDLTVVFRMLCEKKRGEFFYKDASVKIGREITFETELYFISGTVIDMKIGGNGRDEQTG